MSLITNCVNKALLLFPGISCNVSVDKEQRLSKWKNENGCILETLYCSGCSLHLGYVYRCTPKHLDYKRNLFCLSVEAIESYTLGSSEKQIVSEDKELFNLESRVEMEKSLKQTKEGEKIIVEIDDKVAKIRNLNVDSRPDSFGDSQEKVVAFSFDCCYWSVNPEDPQYASQDVYSEH
ncbi:Protein Mis18-alpha [Heterocephalus glaber]|uniref:Protein Mis18-alpha n=1 Tax=Heterocephalus glaber TaxID=10181 RepID=G5BEA1_HETGA|nr:Protein Mis18-alpha [Heterocephalus glaber]